MHSDRSGEIRLSPYLIIIEEIVKVLYKGHIVYVVILSFLKERSKIL